MSLQSTLHLIKLVRAGSPPQSRSVTKFSAGRCRPHNLRYPPAFESDTSCLDRNDPLIRLQRQIVIRVAEAVKQAVDRIMEAESQVESAFTGQQVTQGDFELGSSQSSVWDNWK